MTNSQFNPADLEEDEVDREETHLLNTQKENPQHQKTGLIDQEEQLQAKTEQTEAKTERKEQKEGDGDAKGKLKDSPTKGGNVKQKCQGIQCFGESMLQFLLVVTLVAIMTAAGVGAEVILTPLIKSFFAFSSVHAIALSQICTTVSALIRLMMTYKNRHPYRDSPEIDYNVSVIFLPSAFLGSTVGLIISYFTPEMFSSLLMISILLFSMHRTFLMGVQLQNTEKTGKSSQNNGKQGSQGELGDDSDEYIDDEVEEISMSTITDSEVRKRISETKLNMTMTTNNEAKTVKSAYGDLFPLEKIIAQEKEFILWSKIKLIFATLVVVLLSLVCLGTKDVKSILGLTYSSTIYWFLFLLFILFCLLMIKICIDHVLREQNIKVLYGYIFSPKDIKWSKYTTDAVVTSAFVTGMLSTLTGMAGSIIYAPVLLALNLHPNVSTSTATLLNFFSGLSNAVFAILANQVYYGFCFWLLIWTVIGTIIVKDLIEKTNRTSIVVFMTVVILGLAVLVTVCNDIIELEMHIFQ